MAALLQRTAATTFWRSVLSRAAATPASAMGAERLVAVGGVAMARKWGGREWGRFASSPSVAAAATAGVVRVASRFGAAAAAAGQRSFFAGAVARTNFPVRASEDLQQVHLGALADNPGARKPQRRLARGIGSGRGKTAGRGHKGMKSRSGNKGLLLLRTGQTPLQVALPKRGFSNKAHAYLSLLDEMNLGRLMYFVKSGRVDPSKMIQMRDLYIAGAIRPKVGLKLLAHGVHDKLDMPIHIEVTDCSKKAREIVEAAGGTVKIAYHNRLGLRAHLKPEKFEFIPRRAAPPPKLMWKYPEHYKDVEAQFATPAFAARAAKLAKPSKIAAKPQA